MSHQEYDRRGLNRNELHLLIKENGLKYKKYKSSEFVRILNESGIKWGNSESLNSTCLNCGCFFIKKPKGGKQGKPPKYCSQLCRKLVNGAIKMESTQPRPCISCEIDFIPPMKRGSPARCCSDKCKETEKVKRINSEEYKLRRLKSLEKQYEKGRIKTATKNRICAECGSIHHVKKSWFCSTDCRNTNKKKMSASLRFRDPEKYEDRIKIARNKSKLPEIKERRNECARKLNAKKRKEDPIFALKERVRCRTKDALYGRGFTKGCSTREMLGCEWGFFKKHIESQFTKGMKWSNRNLWHLDHIIPLASANTEEEIIKLCHFTNLRPLWANENIAKADKIITHQPQLTLNHE